RSASLVSSMPRESTETATTEAESRDFRFQDARPHHRCIGQQPKSRNFPNLERKAVLNEGSPASPATSRDPKNGTKCARAAVTQCNPSEIGRNPAPLKAGSGQPLRLRHVVGDIVRCDLVSGGKPNSVVAGDVIHCFLKIFVPERNIDDE